MLLWNFYGGTPDCIFPCYIGGLYNPVYPTVKYFPAKNVEVYTGLCYCGTLMVVQWIVYSLVNSGSLYNPGYPTVKVFSCQECGT